VNGFVAIDETAPLYTLAMSYLAFVPNVEDAVIELLECGAKEHAA
jgi:hypothetical protein